MLLPYPKLKTMKISKSLLSAIATGIVMTATTSCDTNKPDETHSEVIPKLPSIMEIPIRGDTIEVIEIEHDSNYSKDTVIHSKKADKSKRTWSCLACGMG